MDTSQRNCRCAAEDMDCFLYEDDSWDKSAWKYYFQMVSVAMTSLSSPIVLTDAIGSYARSVIQDFCNLSI